MRWAGKKLRFLLNGRGIINRTLPSVACPLHIDFAHYKDIIREYKMHIFSQSSKGGVLAYMQGRQAMFLKTSSMKPINSQVAE